MDPLDKELNPSPNRTASIDVPDDTMKVFLRIRPLVLPPHTTKATEKHAWPKLRPARGLEKKKKIIQSSCIQVCDPHSVSITPPYSLRRMKSELYKGFSQVFSSDSSQEEVYAKVVSPLVEDFLGGKSGLLVASGPSGSGKTHTMFGTAREPGIVPLALRRIYGQDISNRSFHLSIFEIYADNGKSEKLSDLSPDGGDVQMQQSGLIKGLKELHIPDYMEAEALIARALLRRNIGVTNSNSQSSRSQCIIRILCAIESQVNESVLTFVDLAGAEREKKTGNQGARLLESNFINKTSMVFGLCLKSLLEHQKNPKKPLKKHFQSSLLTKYLRDYMEGKKRMALILTVRPAEEDYLDTSFLLRQASPCMEIKFLNKDETSQNKRHCENTFNAASERSKRIKTRCHTDSTDKVTVSAHASDTFEAKPRKVPVSRMKDEVTVSAHASETSEAKPKKVPVSRMKDERILKNINVDSGKEREYKILTGFAKSVWTLLKEHNQKIKVLEKHNIELRKEISDLKSSCSCKKGESLEVSTFAVDTNSETTILSKEFVGHRNAASDPGGEKDEPKKMEKQVDICNNGSDCLEEQSNETVSKSCSSEALQLPEDHITAFSEAIHDEMLGEVKDDAEEKIAAADLGCMGESEAVELLREPVSAFQEASLEEMVREVGFCQSGNMSESEKKTDICKTEAKHPVPDSEAVLDFQRQQSSSFKCKGNMELEPESHSSAPFPILQVEDCQPSNVTELEKSRICETELKHTQDECYPSQNLQGQHLEKADTKETSSGWNEKMPKCISDLSSSVAPKSNRRQSTYTRWNEKTPKCSSDLASSAPPKSNRRQSTRIKGKQTKHESVDQGGENLSLSVTAAKPKRRLMPASSVLLRHVSNLGFEDEGLGSTRGKSRGDDNTRTPSSSSSLLRLLKVDVHR